MMLKLYIYGYLNRVPSSRRLEAASLCREAPSFKLGPAIRSN